MKKNKETVAKFYSIYPRERERRRAAEGRRSHAGTGTGGARPVGKAIGGGSGGGCGGGLLAAGGAWDPGGGEGREPGAGADGDGTQDAVERHGAPHPAPDRPPRQELGEACARSQGPPPPHPLPGARQEAPRYPHQEDQGSVRVISQGQLSSVFHGYHCSRSVVTGSNCVFVPRC